MAWNIEIIIVNDSDKLDVSALVPDIFRPKNKILGFEEATSIERWPNEICATKVSHYGVIINVSSNAKGSKFYEKELSKEREVNIIFVGNQPSMFVYENEFKKKALTGLDACRKKLVSIPYNCDDLYDGELVAWSLIDQVIGERFLDIAYDLEFDSFES